MKLKLAYDEERNFIELRFNENLTLDITLEQANAIKNGLMECICRVMTQGQAGCCAYPVPTEFEVEEFFRIL